MNKKYFNKPVLLIIYNRRQTTEKVFSMIKKMQPRDLYIVADGPKDLSDAVKCNLARKVTNDIRWKCNVHRLYSQNNLGCKDGVVKGINWFFDNVDEGIILEDDCLPSKSFFYFCEQMLNEYRNDVNIMHIGGDNFQNELNKTDNGYYFSKYSQNWGWATWRRAWKRFDSEITDWPKIRKDGKLNYVFDSIFEKWYWYCILDLVYLGCYADVWDYQWQYACWKNNSLSILPSVNLIKNIGFGINATHTKRNTLNLQRLAREISFPIQHVKHKMRDRQKDKNDAKNVFGINLPTIFFLKKKIITQCLKKYLVN